MLIAIEGIDQSGKATQAGAVGAWLRKRGRATAEFSFPAYGTPVGGLIYVTLAGGSSLDARTMQLLFAANRYERQAAIEQALEDGAVVVCDRYTASGVAYGAALGVDPDWLREVHRGLPEPDVTVLLEIDAEITATREPEGGRRDRYERDRALMARAAAEYKRLAAGAGWIRIDAARPAAEVTADVIAALGARLDEAGASDGRTQ